MPPADRRIMSATFYDMVSLPETDRERHRTTQFEALLSAALALGTRRELDELLAYIVRCAADVVGARYSALSTYDADRRIERFHHYGIDEETVHRIGRSPQGRGLLGDLLVSTGPMRLREISDHAGSCGFPPHHPRMHTFLGVPVRIGSRRFGNLYLAERLDGNEFDTADERVAETLATFAATAIEGALLLVAERERAATRVEMAEADERARNQAAMLSMVIDAQEAERARVARDLHDQIGQALTSVLLGLRLVTDALQHDDPNLIDVRRRADDVRSLVLDALTDVRQLAFDLRPTVLDDVGLAAALRRLTDDVHSRHELDIALVIDGLADEARLAPEMETVVYRVVQEALTNVVRHADATTVRISVSATGPALRVRISDDGNGFDVADGPLRSLGLAGMTERAQLAGGTLRITSALGTGAVVELEVPRG